MFSLKNLTTTLDSFVLVVYGLYPFRYVVHTQKDILIPKWIWAWNYEIYALYIKYANNSDGVEWHHGFLPILANCWQRKHILQWSWASQNRVGQYNPLWRIFTVVFLPLKCPA